MVILSALVSCSLPGPRGPARTSIQAPPSTRQSRLDAYVDQAYRAVSVIGGLQLIMVLHQNGRAYSSARNSCGVARHHRDRGRAGLVNKRQDRRAARAFATVVEGQ